MATNAAMTATRETIFFALASEGMGHATRSLPVIEALRARGYRVEVFCGGRVADYLRRALGEVNEHFFISLHYEDNALDIGRTLALSLRRLGTCLRHAFHLYLRMLRERPLAVISDFEFMSAWLGWWSRTPVIALDNMHLITHGDMPPPPTARAASEKRAIAWAVRLCQPVVDKILITSFWHPGLKRGVAASDVRFVPCAVRASVLKQRAHLGVDGPILVYQTSSTNHDLPAVLEAAAATGLRFAVYGAGAAREEGGVHYRAFSEEHFLADLARAPFVVINGGHSTIVEALALGKPVLCEPIKRQYEQEANALGIELLEVGRSVPKLTAATIVDFARDLPRFQARAQQMAFVADNDGVVDAVEEALREVTAARTQRARAPALSWPTR